MAELKVLVLGDGLLGKEIVNQTGWNYISRKKDSFDIENLSFFFNEFKKYSVIVNCIANTDTYSNDKDSHWKTNYVFVDELIKFCNESNIKLVHISTDYLYTGSIENASEEDVPVHCNTWYGYTKLLSDGLIQLQSKDYLLIRCSHKPNPFPYEKAWIDVIGNFDYVDVISNKIIKLINSESNGLFNVGTELKTIYDLAKKTNPIIEPITSNISVPKNISLNTIKMENILNKKPFFSIAIPAYEMHGYGVEFLNHSFNILFTQTFTDFEIVVSDHSKNDDVKRVCEAWSKNLNIKYIRNTENLGSSSSNINNAIKNSNGDWVKLLWQDDFLYSVDSLKNIYDEIQNNKESHWLVTASEHTHDGRNYYMPYYPKWNDNIQYGDNSISSPSVLCIKNEDLIFFDERLIWLMDVDYYKQLYDKWGLPIFLQKINVVNRVWGSQLSNTIPQERKQLEFNLMLEKYKK